MAQSVLVGIGPGELSLVDGSQSAVAMVVSGQTVAAIEGNQSTEVGLIADDPGMAAVGVPSRTMVVVANKVEIAAAPPIDDGFLAWLDWR